jgi:hypothetical protein
VPVLSAPGDAQPDAPASPEQAPARPGNGSDVAVTMSQSELKELKLSLEHERRLSEDKAREAEKARREREEIQVRFTACERAFAEYTVRVDAYLIRHLMAEDTEELCARRAKHKSDVHALGECVAKVGGGGLTAAAGRGGQVCAAAGQGRAVVEGQRYCAAVGGAAGAGPGHEEGAGAEAPLEEWPGGGL